VRLDLNLALGADQPGGWRRIGAWTAAVLLVVAATVANGLSYRALARDIAPAEGRLRALEADLKRLEAQQAESVPAETRAALAALPSRVEAYNRILEEGAFSWTSLLMELEAALPPNVGLTNINPNPASHTVSLVGAGKDLEDITRFVQMLEQRPPFREVLLQRHTLQERGGPGGLPVQAFSIQLSYTWDGAGAPRPQP
jgi:Tfp pilus assembly protein PilN